MALVHGGASFKLFSPSIYNFMCGMDASNLIAGVDEVPQCDVRETYKKVISVLSAKCDSDQCYYQEL